MTGGLLIISNAVLANALDGTEEVAVIQLQSQNGVSVPVTAQTTTQAIANLGGGGSGVPSIAGTANEITETGSPGATTLSIPSDFRLPGTINLVTITQPATAATLTIANNKTFTASNTLTLAGTDSTTMTFPATSATIARTDAAQTFTGTQTFGAVIADTFATSSSNINAQVGTSYTLVASDNGKVVTLNNGSAIALTVPSGLGAGFACSIIQLGAGQVTVTGSGATVNSYTALTKLAGQFAAASLYAYAANTFSMSGQLA